VVRVTYVLPDGALFEECWPATRQAFASARPAAMMIQAGLSDPAMKIEIEVTALKGSAAQESAAQGPAAEGSAPHGSAAM